MIISISGPSRTGKSMIINTLKSSLKDAIFIEDIYYSVWRELVDQHEFKEFTDIIKDRDLMFLYIARVCKKYKEIINHYKYYNNLVVLECCHIDHLIYSQLNLWYHYPLVDFQESMITELLSLRDAVDRIYMTTASDENYPLGKSIIDVKTSKTNFRRNRTLELSFYDLYRDNLNVVTLPPEALSCERDILDDLNIIIGFDKKGD